MVQMILLVGEKLKHEMLLEFYVRSIYTIY